MPSPSAPPPGSCTLRLLPRTDWLAAARLAQQINPANCPPDLDPDDLEDALLADPTRDRLAVDITRYWGAQGVRLTVGFLDSPAADLRARIVSHMNAWREQAHVRFVETGVAADADVRISRALAGHWSRLGTDLRLVDPSQPTMNLQRFTMATDDREFHRVVRHEAGHALGFPHEHMRRAMVARLDRRKVLDHFGDLYGWDQARIERNLLVALEDASVRGTAHPDETSIMCYALDGSLTTDGQPIHGGDDINAADHAFAAAIYPKPSRSAEPPPAPRPVVAP